MLPDERVCQLQNLAVDATWERRNSPVPRAKLRNRSTANHHASPLAPRGLGIEDLIRVVNSAGRKWDNGGGALLLNGGSGNESGGEKES